MNVIKKYNQYLSTSLIAILFVIPIVPVYSQEIVSENNVLVSSESTLPSAPNATVVDKQTPADTVASQASSEASPVQETVNMQEAVSGNTLESTANPETATTTESEVVLIPIVEAGSATTTTESSQTLEVTPDASTASESVPMEEYSSLDVVDKGIDASLPAEETPTPVSVEDLTPQAEYQFALSGKSIPTKKKIKREDGNVVREETVTTSSSPVIDNAQGVVNVSGSCSNVYYVVLLYKKVADYDTDPGSYIVNRAYPCENGSYSYAIDELPPSLSNGTYYLLVGEQGERGTWSPITGLTEISINKN